MEVYVVERGIVGMDWFSWVWRRRVRGLFFRVMNPVLVRDEEPIRG